MSPGHFLILYTVIDAREDQKLRGKCLEKPYEDDDTYMYVLLLRYATRYNLAQYCLNLCHENKANPLSLLWYSGATVIDAADKLSRVILQISSIDFAYMQGTIHF